MTSGTGNNVPTVTGSAPQNGKSSPPQALVKPPQALVKPPQALVTPPQALVTPPQALVKPPQALVKPPQALVTPPQPLVKPPQTLVTPPQALVTPPQALVKPPRIQVQPQVLTHLIEGFVIQEGAKPFPVEHPSFSMESLRRLTQLHGGDAEMEDLSPQALRAAQDEPVLTCELCGRVDFAYIFKRSKRFCSRLCAKRYNVGCTQRMGIFPNRKITVENLKKREEWKNGNLRSSSLESKKKPRLQKPTAGSVSSDHSAHSAHSAHRAQGSASQGSDVSSYDGPPSPLSAASSGAPRDHEGHPELSDLPLLAHGLLPRDPADWNVEDVYEFICSLPGCLAIAEEFRSQEIDGQALLLLKEDHLMGTMNLKLGPALKIYAQISLLKDS